MIEKDLPITVAEKDVLGRDKFAKQLAMMIEAYAKAQDEKEQKRESLLDWRVRGEAERLRYSI